MAGTKASATATPPSAAFRVARSFSDGLAAQAGSEQGPYALRAWDAADVGW